MPGFKPFQFLSPRRGSYNEISYQTEKSLSDENTYELFRRGEALLNTRNPAQAAVVLERARRQEPGLSSVREALGRAYFDSGHYRRAAAEFKVVLELYPTNHYAHYCLARCADKMGNERLSRKHFRLAEARGYEAKES